MNRRRSRAVTLIEVMLTAVIMSLIALAVAPMFRLSQQGFSSVEAHTMLKSEGQDAVNRIAHKLVECKRLFEDTGADNAFLARAQLVTSGGAMTGSRLPVLEETGALSPSSGSFVTASVGNRLFFASVVPPVDVDAADGGGDVRTVRVDHYVFNQYYLTLDATKQVGNLPRRELWEWHSPVYADYNQIVGIPDATRRANVVTSLVSSGTTRAWNPAATSVTAAFYTLDAGGGIAAESGHLIPEATCKRMIRIMAGATAGGFRWGISPNTGGGFETGHPVPRFATANANFPSGLEVVAVGPSSARQVFLRMVLAAQGTFAGNISSEQVALTTVRDLW